VIEKLERHTIFVKLEQSGYKYNYFKKYFKIVLGRYIILKYKMSIILLYEYIHEYIHANEFINAFSKYPAILSLISNCYIGFIFIS